MKREGRMRRWVLPAAVIAFMLVLVFAAMAWIEIGGRSGSRASSGEPCAQPGKDRASPSGKYHLVVANGPLENGVHTLTVAIVDSAGNVMYHSKSPYSLRFGACMTWSPRKDLAWLASNDVGIKVVEPDPKTGKWKEQNELALIDRSDIPPIVLESQPYEFNN